MKFKEITAEQADQNFRAGRVTDDVYKPIRDGLLAMKEALFIEIEEGEKPAKLRSWITKTAKSLNINVKIQKTPGGFTVKALD